MHNFIFWVSWKILYWVLENPAGTDSTQQAMQGTDRTCNDKALLEKVAAGEFTFERYTYFQIFRRASLLGSRVQKMGPTWGLLVPTACNPMVTHHFPGRRPMRPPTRGRGEDWEGCGLEMAREEIRIDQRFLWVLIISNHSITSHIC